jgi:hypothetical protein
MEHQLNSIIIFQGAFISKSKLCIGGSNNIDPLNFLNNMLRDLQDQCYEIISITAYDFSVLTLTMDLASKHGFEHISTIADSDASKRRYQCLLKKISYC